MIKVTEKIINEMENQYPGITEQIMQFENKALPACSQCGSDDTASVQVGVIGRTIYLATATSKFHLIPNRNKEPDFYCNRCRRYFHAIAQDSP